MKELLTKDWLEAYLTNVTGEDITYERGYTFISALDKAFGVVERYSGEYYSFNVYVLSDGIYLRDGEKRVKIETLEELDRIINRQAREHDQV